jgi:hypothetical protein
MAAYIIVLRHGLSWTKQVMAPLALWSQEPRYTIYKQPHLNYLIISLPAIGKERGMPGPLQYQNMAVYVKIGLYWLCKAKERVMPCLPIYPYSYHNQHNVPIKVKIGLNWLCKAKNKLYQLLYLPSSWFKLTSWFCHPTLLTMLKLRLD